VEYCSENVIVDLTGLADPAHRQALREAVDRAGLAEHVRWYE
jgi:acyl-CoA hydrolase